MAAPRVATGSTVAAENERKEALAAMDLLAITRAYVLAAADSAQGYKGLLLDAETMRMASTICGRTELAEHNIVHIERLDAKDAVRKPHRELKVRPGAFSIRQLHGACCMGPAELKRRDGRT